MLLAEKIVTIVDRGAANTRWRDFLDVLKVSEKCTVDGNELIMSTETVGAYRSVKLHQLTATLKDMDSIAQTKWSSWRKKQHLEDVSPESFTDLSAKLITFADPPLKGAAKNKTWNPLQQSWD